MKLRINLGIFGNLSILNLSILLLVFLSSCSYWTISKGIVANASEELLQEQKLPVTAKANISGEIIHLEVAETPEQQSKGLMFRKPLADNRGMLFPFPSERLVSFWMKNVSISLDMVFLSGKASDKQGYRVVGIAADVPPCKAEPCPVYGPDALVNQVIELQGGRTQELGLKVGDKIMVRKLDSRRGNLK